MSNELDTLTQQGAEALRVGDQTAADKAFAQRDTLANELFGNTPVPSVTADGEIVENLADLGTEPRTPEDNLAEAQLHAVLSQSVSGRGLSAGDIERARVNGLAFDKEHPEWGEQWAEYAQQSADNMGFVMSRLASGSLPDGPPSKFADTLASVSQKHQAQRELDALYASNPPGTPGYHAVLPRVTALNELLYGSEPICGRWGRTA